MTTTVHIRHTGRMNSYSLLFVYPVCHTTINIHIQGTILSENICQIIIVVRERAIQRRCELQVLWLAAAVDLRCWLARSVCPSEDGTQRTGSPMLPVSSRRLSIRWG